MGTCNSCQSFQDDIQIRLPHELDSVIRRASAAVTDGTLRIVDGSLQWNDYISCKLKCSTCGQEFDLDCETYHGAGGHWRPVSTS